MTDNYSFGLLGYPLGHSLSPLIHAAARQAHNLGGEYWLFPLKDKQRIPELIDRLREGTLQGLNVTIPYKSNVIEFMDELTPTARSIGAVNTISYQRNRVIGENTDAGGFLADLARLGWFPESDRRRQALILGSGGSARAVAYALYQDGWQLTIAGRRLEQAEQLVGSLQKVKPSSGRRFGVASILLDLEGLASIQHSPDMIVNTTPLGMSPYKDGCPWPADLALPPQAAVYDLVYNPVDTEFTRTASAAGLQAASGIGMLVEQAALSFEIWTGLAAPRDDMHASLSANSPGAR
jgi:shikimate dehydrogenase